MPTPVRSLDCLMCFTAILNYYLLFGIILWLKVFNKFNIHNNRPIRIRCDCVLCVDSIVTLTSYTFASFHIISPQIYAEPVIRRINSLLLTQRAKHSHLGRMKEIKTVTTREWWQLFHGWEVEVEVNIYSFQSLSVAQLLQENSYWDPSQNQYYILWWYGGKWGYDIFCLRLSLQQVSAVSRIQKSLCSSSLETTYDFQQVQTL